ncbi:MAG TPA: hypothetical protein VGB39_03175 [Sphingomicrobium sp.]|jgi:hypothetical protein
MRVGLMILPLALMAGPALGQAKPAPAAPAIPPAIPQVLRDPATADRLAGMMQALSKAFLNLPIGEVEAAAEGRAVTPADRNRTLREVGRKDNPNFERDLQATLAGSRATMQASMKALAAALPGMMKGLADAGREMEKAAENMPRPNYPKR